MKVNEEKKSTIKKKGIKAKLPKLPFSNIAISLSGGGFRATGYHLGVLSYLSKKKIYGTSLLEKIRILSTASAGTFVGVKYIATLKRGDTIQEAYNELYNFIGNCDLVEEALQYLSDDNNWPENRHRTLINAFAAIYHQKFENENFGLLWDDTHPIHVKEISFNATEFNFAMPFRFMKTERAKGSTENEFIGNNKIHIPIDLAKDIRLADIVAASSCFPFGFEPINFPDDFIHSEDSRLNNPALLPYHVYDGDIIEYPIGLMDGGIDDNQGVDAVVNAEERMKGYQSTAKNFRSEDKKAVDLFIISDASIPRMESYTKSPKSKKSTIGLLNFQKLRSFGILSTIIGMGCWIGAFFINNKFGSIALASFGTIGMLVALVMLIFSLGFAGFTKLLGVPEFFAKRLGQFDKIHFQLLYTLIAERRRSAMKLVSKVFIKQMRWFSYQRVYGDVEWRPRLIMNAIFDMTIDEVDKRNIKYPNFSEDILIPGQAIIATANKANSMSTTLWFTEKEMQGENNMLDTVIACGQFNICFNLIEYFEKFIKNTKYSGDYEKYNEDTKLEINLLHNQLIEDWKKFKVDPYWMVKEWNAKMKSESND